MDTRNLTGLIEIEIELVFSSRELKIHNTPEDIESIFIEINLIKNKWLFCGYYHPPSQPDQYFFEIFGKTLDKYLKHYDKFMLNENNILGDFQT